MAVEQGREAFERRAWSAAYEHLTADGELGPQDLELLAIAANLTGHDDESVTAWERAHEAHLRDGDAPAAARCAFWAAFLLMFRGHMARAGGWLARAERAVAETDGECAAAGFLLVPAFLGAHESGAVDEARALADRIIGIAHRCGDRDLLAVGLLCQGEAAMALGETAAGMRAFDDALVSVTSGEVSPIPAGIVSCGVIEACVNAFDLRRAAEWTEMLTDWCAQQPDLVPFRGQCLVHRSQVLQARGSWPDAERAAEDAHRQLSEVHHPALGAALYQLGELHRVRGELAAAEQAYRQASQHGREPEPGLALLRLAQGQVDAAVATIQRTLDERQGRRVHPATLAAAVEVRLAAGDAAAARRASDELANAIDGHVAPYVRALAAFCSGSVQLAEGDAAGALVALREAQSTWRALEMPYEAARASVQIARACRALSDHDAAGWQLEDALETFERLGARTELVGAGRLARSAGMAPSVLTARQCDVLRAVATGKSNREVAAALHISEHTVARHLQNIFTKLGLQSRAAATSYAHEHGLL